MTATLTRPRVGVYLRQSRDVENTGMAIDRQREDCLAMAAARGWDVVAMYPDNDTSATSGKPRPGFLRMQADVKAGKLDIVLSQVMDRLLRSNRELEDLVDLTDATGVLFNTVKSGDLNLTTPDGRQMARFLATIAKGEVEKKADRQRRAALHRAEQGLPPARRAFGYTDDNLIDPVEGPALAALYEMKLSGVSMTRCVEWMNEHGHVTTTGKAWSRSSVREMLRNPRNAGLREYHGEIIGAGVWEPIVSEEIWRAYLAQLADPERRTSWASYGRKWVGSGVFLCGRCGSTMNCKYRRNVRYYKCATRTHLSRVADPVDEWVDAVMVEFLAREDLAELVSPSTDGPAVALRAEAKRLRLRLTQIEADYADADADEPMSLAEYRRLTKPVTAKLAAVNADLGKFVATTAVAAAAASGDPVRYWREAEVGMRQSIIRSAITVTILPLAKVGQNGFDPAGVRIEPVALDGESA